MIKLVPSAYFETKEDKDFGYFKLACYEGVNNSSTFPSVGLKVSSKRLLKRELFSHNKGLKNTFTTFKCRLKQRLWNKDNDFFDRHEAFAKAKESELAEENRERSILRLKCFTLLKLIFEQQSYVSFEREMYYLHEMGMDVGTIDHSTYFVDKCLKRLATIIQKTIRDDFCEFDEVTQSLPDFSTAADGSTDREKTGETVIIS